MIQASLLKTLYFQCPLNLTAPLRSVVETLFDETCLDERLISQVLSSDNWLTASASPNEVLEKWRDILTLVLVFRSKQCLEPHISIFIKRVRDLQRISLWPEHQLISLYQAIVAFLLGYLTEFTLDQQSNGWCPLEVNSYTFSGEVPQPFFQAELGVLLCLYADLTGRSDYLNFAVNIAKWQRNTLDHCYFPFVGLLSKEGEASERLLSINNFLLFNAVARLLNCSEMAFLAEKQLEQLAKISSIDSLDIPSYSIVLEAFFQNKSFPIILGKCCLPPIVRDDDLAMVGCRSLESSAIATLYGGVSGMGCYHYKDIKIMTFGLQHQPLGDCTGFGVEGSSRSLFEYIKKFSVNEERFFLEGVSRLSPYVPVVRTEEVQGGRWLESRQKFEKGIFSIKAKFLGLFEENELVFSFFVKCKTCVTDDNEVIKPRSLNRYHGKSLRLNLQGKDAIMSLQGGQNHDEMHVIPLGGGDNFWGADFLVAYVLKDLSRAYSWELSPHSTEY